MCVCGIYMGIWIICVYVPMCMHVCMCASVCLCMCVCAYVYSFMWKPITDVRNYPQSILQLILIRQGLSPIPELTTIVSFSSQFALVIPVSISCGRNYSRPPNPSSIYKSTEIKGRLLYTTNIYMGSWGFELWSSCLHSKNVSLWAIFPAPIYIF